jgi:DNA-binding YbaB/EbfC family protein
MFNQKMMRQVQSRIEKINEELAELRVEASAGGGVIKAIANGQQQILSVEIDPTVVDAEDVEMLQDLVVVVVNEALAQARDVAAKRLASATGGLGLPGRH